MIQVYEVEPGRWGYRVDSVVQEWHPDKDGFVGMSQVEAEALALRQQALLSNDPQASSDPDAGLTKLAFMLRFTDQELAGIYAAAKVSPLVEVWLEKMKLTTGNIFLSDPRTVAGVRAIEAAGLIAQGRAEEILT